MKEDALDRLSGIAEEISNDSAPVYSLEEQMASAQENENTFSEMAVEDKDEVMTRIQEITLDEPAPETPSEEVAPVVEEPKSEDTVKESDEGLFNCNNTVKKQRGRPSKNKAEVKVEQSDTNSGSIQYNPIMDKLANDIIADLRKNKYAINGFDDKLMQIVFDYMQTKF
jgi:hypothetical protein